MKIVVLSRNRAALSELCGQLQRYQPAALLVEGESPRLQESVEREQADLLLLDHCCDALTLSEVERLSARQPRVGVILLCSGRSADFLLEAMRVGVREVIPAPASAAVLEAAVARALARLRGDQGQAPGRLLAFIPCKGGSGATFLVTNIALQLASARTVLLVDLNLQFGDALSYLHDGKPASTIADVARDIGRLDAAFLGACAVRITDRLGVLSAPLDPDQAVDISADQVDALLALALTCYDFVLVDLGRPVSAHALRALDRASMIFPVLQADLPSIRNAKKMLGIFTALGYGAERIELIVNRFEKSGPIDLPDIQRSLGRFSLHSVPNAYKRVSASISHVDPLATSAPSNPVARTLQHLARALSPLPQPQRGWLARLGAHLAA